jgi:two-component system response regulator TctD
MTKSIFILEDDRLLAETLTVGMKALGVTVYTVYTLSDFHRLLETKRVHVCIMDRMIGSEDSVQTVEYIRDAFPEIRVLLLTKKSSIPDRISGLEAGAHDYLPKPFSLAELRLRVKLLLAQHASAQEGREVSLGEITYSSEQGCLQTRTGAIFLRPRENEILLCLSHRLGNLVSRQKITRTLWPESYTPHPSTVDVYIRRLRQKLGAYRSILQTRRGFGYRLLPFYGKAESNARTSSSP